MPPTEQEPEVPLLDANAPRVVLGNITGTYHGGPMMTEQVSTIQVGSAGLPGYALTREEHPDERADRLAEKRAEARAKRLKDYFLFGTALVAAVVIGGVCLWLIISPTASAAQFELAKNLLILIVGGFLGYLIKKES